MKKAAGLKLDRAELAYLAGLFDGEGYFGFYMDQGKKYVQIQVVNTDLDLLRPFLIFGGNIYHRSKPQKANHNESFAYTVKGKRIVINFILSVYWYLKNEKKKIRMREFLKNNMNLLRESDVRLFALELRR